MFILKRRLKLIEYYMQSEYIYVFCFITSYFCYKNLFTLFILSTLSLFYIIETKI